MRIEWDWTATPFLPGIGIHNATGFFRGVPFRIDSYETTVGRRGEVHEYPLRNLPNAEDLGRKARRFNFAAYIMGPGYDLVRDALINACEADGPGQLIHPFHGTHTVLCETGSVSESRQGGRRMAIFNLSFVEHGDFKFPDYEPNQGQQALDQASDGYPVIEGAFVG